MRIFSCLSNLPHIIKVMLLVANLPTVVALQNSNPFPDIPFKPFSDFVEATFGSTISLSTVLLLIFLFWKILSYSVYMLGNNAPFTREKIGQHLQVG
ncbi:hypothetical protein L208DRAFT_1511064 [Tricholoma matsutake]|nr:hypothetical protein L208DRAFT_1511064 [Tricholoma matsutake 945]